MAAASVCPTSSSEMLMNDMDLPQFTGSTVVCDLTQAIFQRDLTTLKALAVEKGISHTASRVYDNQKRVWRMECALVTASRLGFLEAVKVLVEAGALVDMTDQIIGKSPLHWACNRHHNDVAKFLLANGADVDKTDYYMEPPLVEAVCHKNFGLVRLLLNHRARLDSIVNYDRDSIVLLALSINATEIAIFLIRCGGLLSTVNREGEDCMTVALTNPAIADHSSYLVQLLLAAGFKLWIKHLDVARRIHPALEETLADHHNSPPLLSWLARRAIRNHLFVVSGHSSIMAKVEQLPLPEWLRQYVLLFHI